MINSILNEKEIWLPVSIRRSGLLRPLNIEDCLSEYGLLIPTDNSEKLLLNGLRTGEYLFSPEDGSCYRAYLIDKDLNLHYFFITNNTSHTNFDKLTKTFVTTAVKYQWIERMLACNYAFRNGKVKTPKQLLTKLRKGFEAHIPYEKHSLKELLEHCVEKHGEFKPLPSIYKINKDVIRQKEGD